MWSDTGLSLRTRGCSSPVKICRPRLSRRAHSKLRIWRYCRWTRPSFLLACDCDATLCAVGRQVSAPKLSTFFPKEQRARVSFRHYQLTLSPEGGSILSSTAKKGLDQACLTRSENASWVS